MESAKNADAALRVQRAVDRIDHDERRAVADDAGLLGDDRQTVEPSKRARIARSAAASIAVVSSPPFAGPDDRLAVGATRQLGEHAAHVLDRSAAEARASQSSGWKSRPEVSLG